MEATSLPRPQASREHWGDRSATRSAEVRQYSLVEILAVWAAAAVPMGLLSWVGAPWLGNRLGGSESFVQALFILFTAGLIWQFLLVVILTRREVGVLRWSRVREALWLRAPQDPNSGRAGGRVWWWALLSLVLVGAWQLVPSVPGPSSRDFAAFLASDRSAAFFRDAWGWFALIVVSQIFNSVLGEELLFRGLLLPRMRGVFGKWDWIANGVLFAVYHLHVPWRMPSALADTFLLAYPSRRFRSAWMGIIVHSGQSVFTILVVLGAVLR